MLQQMAPDVNASLFLLTFAEGFLAFISPCILPLLPIYLLYLGGGEQEGKAPLRLLINTLGFILGFSLVFVFLGASASAFGNLLISYRVLLQRVGGIIVILFGLNYIGLFQIGFLNKTKTMGAKVKDLKFFSSLLFGAIFSLGWTPCLGAFLGTALLLASSTGTLYQGMGLLLTFSLGLGIPFLLTALLWGKLQGAFAFIKRNLRLIQIVSGALLIVVGLLMFFDLFHRYATILL